MKISESSIFNGARGKLGGMYFRTFQGRTILARCPTTSRGGRSLAQRAKQDRFKEASMFASKQIANPLSKALYATGITEKKHTAYLVAMSDFLNSPTVHSINAFRYRGAIGNRIVVKATDDFEVVRVSVTITDSSGIVIEQGHAVVDSQDPESWIYKVTVKNKNVRGTTIRAVAEDIPGNKGMGKVEITVGKLPPAVIVESPS